MYCDILTQPLPEVVLIDGKEFPISWDFRTGLKFESILRGNMEDSEKYRRMLHLYYPKIPANITEAVEKILWFYRCGEELETDEKERYQRRKPKEPACVFAQDAPYIYAAFREQYNIDLTTIGKLHWWKFMALFESLGEDTKMSKIMYYRKAGTSGMSKERRSFLNEMKKLYRIRESDVRKMTLNQRNQNWIDYVTERYSRG